MKTISKTYRVKWQLKFDHKYVWSECGKLFNFKTGRQIKKTVKGSKIGYWIGSSFFGLDELRSQIEKIKKTRTPF